jgi:hypothetical protein
LPAYGRVKTGDKEQSPSHLNPGRPFTLPRLRFSRHIKKRLADQTSGYRLPQNNRLFDSDQTRKFSNPKLLELCGIWTVDVLFQEVFDPDYLNFLELSSTGLEAACTMPTHISPSFDNSVMWFS